MQQHQGPETTPLGALPGWVVLMAMVLFVLVLGFLFILCRRKTHNRKQMSDLDVLDTYKQGWFAYSNRFLRLLLFWPFGKIRNRELACCGVFLFTFFYTRKQGEFMCACPGLRCFGFRIVLTRASILSRHDDA